MKCNINDHGIELNFSDTLEAYQFLNAIFSYKHGELEKVHDLGNVFLRNREVYELSRAIETFIDQTSTDSGNEFQSFVLEKQSLTFNQILNSLKLSFIGSYKKPKLSNMPKSSARLWVKCHFAPCILSDELADLVIKELRN